MIFTRHTYERYRQFHMLDQPTATDADAQEILTTHAAHAVRVRARTHRGDEVWTIHALGVELVVKRDGDFKGPVCVTVLPPTRFRGLTPLLAELAEESARRAAERVIEAEQRLEAAKRAKAEQIALAEQAAKVKKEKDKAGTSSVIQAAAHAAAAARKQAAAQAQRDHDERIQQAKSEGSYASNERDIILEALRGMRAQLALELRTGKYKTALRIAVRYLRDLGATDILARIGSVDPGLESVWNRRRLPLESQTRRPQGAMRPQACGRRQGTQLPDGVLGVPCATVCSRAWTRKAPLVYLPA